MIYHKIFKSFCFLFIFLSMTSCGHLPEDKFPNPSSLGFHRMEFDIVKDGISKKELGIGNIYLKEGESLEDVYFKIYGLYSGTLTMKSNACGINFSTRFRGISTFYLKDLISYPRKCSIRISAVTDAIENREHNIVESGIIKLNVLSDKAKPLTFQYTRTDSKNKKLFKEYIYKGQGSLQRQAGDLTFSETFLVKTDLTEGGFYRISGCDNSLTGDFDKDTFEISLKKFYLKDYLKREDSCDIEILVIPNEVIERYAGRFSLSIYDEKVVKLEPMLWLIKKRVFKYRIYAWGSNYIFACGINFNIKTDQNCNARYYKNKIYWIRSITTNARKNVFAVKNGKVIWKE